MSTEFWHTKTTDEFWSLSVVEKQLLKHWDTEKDPSSMHRFISWYTKQISNINLDKDTKIRLNDQAISTWIKFSSKWKQTKSQQC